MGLGKFKQKLHFLQLVVAISLMPLLLNSLSYADQPLVPDAQCSSFIDGPPVGLACIHCTHSKAQAQAMALADIMRASCRKRLVVNYLIDGRFEIDDEFLVNHISTLAENRRLMVVFYLSNGPSIRRADRSVPTAFAAGISTNQFRSQIITSKSLRTAYQNIVQRAMRVKALVPDHVRFVFVPQLEDNLTDASFVTLLNLTKEVAGDAVGYQRSACIGCAPGNGQLLPGGVMRESHSAISDIYQGTVTNDGFPYSFARGVSNGAMPLSKLTASKDSAQNLGTAFILWTAKYQGTPVKNGKTAGRILPSNRLYAMPTSSERAELINFMK